MANEEHIPHPSQEPGAKHTGKMPPPKEAWESQPKPIADQVIWLHAYMLEQGKTLGDLKADVGYDAGTISKIFNGKYPGNMDLFAKAVAAFRRVLSAREDVGQMPFVETRVSRKLWKGLDFAIGNGGLVEIIGESRLGKTRATEEWIRARGFEGRAFLIRVPPRQSPNAVLMLVAEKLGVSSRHYGTKLIEEVQKCLNESRLIIVDEAHRMIPHGARCVPYGMEHLRDLHDETGCAVAVLTTSRFLDIKGDRDFMYEQWNGRVDLTITLPTEYKDDEVRALLTSYFPRMSERMVADVLGVVNARGRLGTLRRLLNMARRIAAKAEAGLEEAHFYQAVKLLKQLEKQTPEV